MDNNQTDLLTYLSGGLPVKHSPLPDYERGLMTLEATSCLHIYQFLKDISHAGSFGKMSPVSCHLTKEKILEPSSEGWQNAGMGSPTGFLTLNISEWTAWNGESRNDDGVCSLSDILETGDLPERLYLSPKACAGILRRAEKREKEFPKMLRQALQEVCARGPV